MDFPTLTSRICRRNNLARLISLVMATLLFIILVSGAILRFYPFNAAPLDDEQFMDRHQYYTDIDGDRKSEHIVFTSYSGTPVMEIFASDEPFLDVIRISGDHLDNRISLHVGYTDLDGFGEIYLLSRSMVINLHYLAEVDRKTMCCTLTVPVAARLKVTRNYLKELERACEKHFSVQNLNS